MLAVMKIMSRKPSRSSWTALKLLKENEGCWLTAGKPGRVVKEGGEKTHRNIHASESTSIEQPSSTRSIRLGSRRAMLARHMQRAFCPWLRGSFKFRSLGS